MTIRTALITAWCAVSLAANAAFAVHPIFLETDMRAAWSALLSVGGREDYKQARELVNEMLEDCHGRATAVWGEECDRVLYLEAVLDRATAAPGATTANVSKEEQGIIANGIGGDNVADAASAAQAQEVTKVSEALPFSTFFLEFAVPRRPVIFPMEDRQVFAGTAALDIESEQRAPPAVSTGAMDDPEEKMSHGENQSEKNYSSRSSTSRSDSASATTTAVIEDDVSDQRVLDVLTECVPYPKAEKSPGTANGPLRTCDAGVLLERLTVPRYVVADYVQRFRAKDIVPAQYHQDIEKFASG